MLILSLFRHAKSSWDDPLQQDFDRPLALRGERAAPLMGTFIAEHGLMPDLIVCSGSARTRQTLGLAAQGWASRSRTIYADALYHATLPTLFAQMRAAPGEPAHLMMVGHNPGLHELALQLAGAGEPADLRNLAHKFPSGALAVIAFGKPHWRDIGPGDGHLTLFKRPKDLRDPT